VLLLQKRKEGPGEATPPFSLSLALPYSLKEKNKKDGSKEEGRENGNYYLALFSYQSKPKGINQPLPFFFSLPLSSFSNFFPAKAQHTRGKREGEERGVKVAAGLAFQMSKRSPTRSAWSVPGEGAQGGEREKGKEEAQPIGE